MADVIKTAVANRRRVPKAPITLRIDGVVIELTPSDVQTAMRRARDTRRPCTTLREPHSPRISCPDWRPGWLTRCA